jgi:hypothetical protein
MWVTPTAAGWDGCVFRPAAVLALCLCTQAVSADDSEPAPKAEAAAPPYGAVGRVKEAVVVPESFSKSETRAIEHTMGPAFSMAESMPGVVPVFSGVPYLIVRGATPAGSLYYYDGVQLPALFHLALGPSVTDPLLSAEAMPFTQIATFGPASVVDPQLSSGLAFYPAAAPSYYDAHIGGILERNGPDAEGLSRPLRSLQISALDASGAFNLPTDDGSFSLSWTYGNPGLMLRALGLDATLGYYDYQLRYHKRLSENTRLVTFLLGGGDHLGERTAPADDISLSYHRFLTRLLHRVGPLELTAQLVLASDASTLGQQLSGHAERATSLVSARWKGRRAQLLLGAELASASVKLSRGASTGVPNGSPLTRTTSFALDPQDFLDGQPYTSVPNRSVISGFASLQLDPGYHLHFELGARIDGFIASSEIESAISPMFRAHYRPALWLDLHAAAAIGHSPRTSPLPIPGLNDIALDRGIQAAIQSEVGATVDLAQIALLEATLFYHRYLDVVYMELILDCQGNTNPAAAQVVLTQPDPRVNSICRRSGLPTADGDSYGLEMFLKRNLTERLSGFVSYTLAFAKAVARDGTEFTPQADVRHLINAVLQLDLGHGFSLGARFHFRTGKMGVNTIFNLSTAHFTRLEERLPSFVRLDLRAAYAFDVSFGRVEIAGGLQNATFSREATNRDCFAPLGQVMCRVDYQPYIVLPNVGVRVDF